MAKRKTPDKDTLRELYLKSGNQCAFPGCARVPPLSKCLLAFYRIKPDDATEIP